MFILADGSFKHIRIQSVFESNYTHQISNIQAQVHELSENRIAGRKRAWLPDGQFKDANTKKRQHFIAIKKEFSASSARFDTLKAFIFLSDHDGVGSPSIGQIMEKREGDECYNTVWSHMKWWESKRVLTSRNGSRKDVPRHKTPPKEYALTGYKYKLEDYSPETGNSLNSCKVINNFTYICDVDKSFDKPEKTRAKPRPPYIRPRGHIDESKLKDLSSECAQKEIQRAATQRELTPTQTTQVLSMLQLAKGIASKGAYLSAMINGVKSGTWNVKRMPAKPKKKENEPTMYGVSVAQIEREARPGETYQQAAERLRKVTN